MFFKLRNHLVLALLFYLLTLFQQYSFFYFKKIPIVPFEFQKYGIIFLFFFFLTFIKSDRFRFLGLSLILILNFFQMAHLSYFGTQILPSEIYLLFSEFHEVFGTLKEDSLHIIIPLLFTSVPLGIGWKVHQKTKMSFGWKIIEIILVIYFLYNPLRTYFTGNTWGRQPSTRELAGMNVYLSFSYFVGRILPHKLTLNEAHASTPNSSLELNLDPHRASEWDKIVLILGESLTPQHMQLFGYERETTPFLNSLKNDKTFFHTIGLSGGVSTDISVAYFLNLGFGQAGALKAAKANHCLFKIAKSQGFKTHFYSIQSSQQLRYISPYLCSSFLDELKTLEDISPQTIDHQAALDRDLIAPLMNTLKDSSKKLLMLHQRGSHSPWVLRFSSEAKKFSGSKDSRTDYYDNSVYEFDLFWKHLDQELSKTNQKVLVVYLSDHGEALGVKGKWGHGFLESSAFEVPILIKSYNKALPQETRNLPKFMTHYNLGLWIAQETGYKLNQSPYELPKDYEIYGNDIDGFAGKVRVKFHPQGYSYHPSN